VATRGPIVSRAGWNARPPSRAIQTVAWSQRTGVAVHHSAGSVNQTTRDIQNFHMDTNDWPDIGYNFLTDQAGNLIIGRGWDKMGTHSAGENISHVAICWKGNSNDVVPTPAALNTIRWVYEEACRLADRTLEVSGHGQLPNEATQCPGDHIRNWIAAGMPLGGDDMTPEEHDLLVNIRRELSAFTSGSGSWTTTGGSNVSIIKPASRAEVAAIGNVTLSEEQVQVIADQIVAALPDGLTPTAQAQVKQAVADVLLGGAENVG